MATSQATAAGAPNLAQAPPMEDARVLLAAIYPEIMSRLQACIEQWRRIEEAKRNDDIEELKRQANRESLRRWTDHLSDQNEVEDLRRKKQLLKQAETDQRAEWKKWQDALTATKKTCDSLGLDADAEALERALQAEQDGVAKASDRYQSLFDKKQLEQAGGRKGILVAANRVTKGERDEAKLNVTFTEEKLHRLNEREQRCERAVRQLMQIHARQEKVQTALHALSEAEKVRADALAGHDSYCCKVVELQDEIAAIPRLLESSEQDLQSEIDEGSKDESELFEEKDRLQEAVVIAGNKFFDLIMECNGLNAASAALSGILRRKDAKLKNLHEHIAAARQVEGEALQESRTKMQEAQSQRDELEKKAGELEGSVRSRTAQVVQAATLNSACAATYARKMTDNKEYEKSLCKLELEEMETQGRDIDEDDMSNDFAALVDQKREKEEQLQTCETSLQTYKEQATEACRQIDVFSELGLDAKVDAAWKAATDVVGKSYRGRSMFEDQYQRKKMEQQRQHAIVLLAAQDGSDDDD